MANPDIAKLREELANSSIGEDRPMTPRRIILSLMPEIQDKRAQGATLAQLVDWFAQRGVKTTTGAISNYIHEYQKEKGVATGVSAPVDGPSVRSVAQRNTGPILTGTVPSYKNL